MILKIEGERLGDHVHMTVRVGEVEGSLAHAGVLVLRIGEYQVLGAALLLGAAQTQGHLTVTGAVDLNRGEDP